MFKSLHLAEIAYALSRAPSSCSIFNVFRLV